MDEDMAERVKVWLSEMEAAKVKTLGELLEA